MYPWPGSRGSSSSGRGGYFGPSDPRFRNRNTLLTTQVANRAMGLSEAQFQQGWGGGWAGPWGQWRAEGMQSRFNRLQPGYVRRGRSSYGNAPRYGGFI